LDGENVTLLIAFAAGVLSFASPCVLPLVPAYLGHMVAVSAERPGSPSRLVSLLHAASFVSGFSLVFITFWTSIGLIGFLFLDNARYLRELGGAVLIFMGLHLLGVINIGFMNREYSVNQGQPGQGGKAGYPRSMVMGMTFAAGWTPCIGPVLGSILGLAVIGGSVPEGAVLLLAYSAGLGVPFLIMALAVEGISSRLKRIRPVLAMAPLVSGLLVVAVGLLMLTNSLIRINQYFDWGYV
jgi:cytochrome c-type biogenesis protein